MGVAATFDASSIFGAYIAGVLRVEASAFPALWNGGIYLHFLGLLMYGNMTNRSALAINEFSGLFGGFHFNLESFLTVHYVDIFHFPFCLN